MSTHSLAFLLPPDSLFYFCHQARFRSPENAIPRMLQFCTGPNLVLPHLYPHNPTHQRNRFYILYRRPPHLSLEDEATLNNSTRNARDGFSYREMGNGPSINATRYPRGRSQTTKHILVSGYLQS